MNKLILSATIEYILYKNKPPNQRRQLNPNEFQFLFLIFFISSLLLMLLLFIKVIVHRCLLKHTWFLSMFNFIKLLLIFNIVVCCKCKVVKLSQRFSWSFKDSLVPLNNILGVVYLICLNFGFNECLALANFPRPSFIWKFLYIVPVFKFNSVRSLVSKSFLFLWATYTCCCKCLNVYCLLRIIVTVIVTSWLLDIYISQVPRRRTST